MAIRRVPSWLRYTYLSRCSGAAVLRRRERGSVGELNYVARRGFCACRTFLAEDKVTHTGQKWDDKDYRSARFVDREKQVNEQFAIDLLSEEPVVCVKGTHVYCDGGRGALGHPKVYINLDKPEINDCGYCGKRFLAEKYKEQFPKENYVDQS